MKKENLKELRSLIKEIEEEQSRMNTLGAWSLFHDEKEVFDRNRNKIMLIDEWIENIDDSFVRRSLKLRYVDGNSWAQVAYKMGYSSPDGPRKLVDRYLSRYGF